MDLTKILLLTALGAGLLLLGSCKSKQKENEGEFRYTIDQFADIKIIRYKVPDWDKLSLQQKELLYYLGEAAKAGRDIIWDQNFKHNLIIRHTLEAIEKTYKGDKDTPEYNSFLVYLKRIWVSNGIHHHYGNYKIVPDFSKEYFAQLIENSDMSGVKTSKTSKELTEFLTPIIFDPSLYAMRSVTDNPEHKLLENSACNYYDGVTTAEAEEFYEKMAIKDDPRPISYGLNSRLVKKDGVIAEDIYKIDGLYGDAIKQIVFWLEKASTVADNNMQKSHILKLVEYYKTGNLRTFDEYNILWVQDTLSMTDYVNGFIENYGDPLGMKASWEAIADFKNLEATKRADIISANAQWFEDNAPIDPRFRKEKVKGVSAKVINVTTLGGDCFPPPPIGINLPNADWIRRDYGSKSVTIQNLTDAYDKSAQEGKSLLSEFAIDENEIARSKKYGNLASNLTTDLHECLGHGSGKLLPGTSSEALKNYSSTLEETRADLFALYYIMDPKLIEIGLFDSEDLPKAEYDGFIRNGLMTQLIRIEEGKNIEEAHMRNRSLVSHYAYEKGKADNVIEMLTKDGKTYIKINDYQKLRSIFAELLAEVQRIKSEGDYEAGKALVEKYAINVEPALHREVLARYKTLNLAPYGGFVNPVLTPVEKNGKIIDVKVSYTDDFKEQMLEYGKKYSFLPY
ncbi:MAG: dipeptidyl peptidase 3 [Bacteroidales bacterium]|jgi:dipeptidyl-peptidase-3|nr:dipeptidyl peptidase 3 [Bacteroidales bacterium]